MSITARIKRLFRSREAIPKAKETASIKETKVQRSPMKAGSPDLQYKWDTPDEEEEDEDSEDYEE